jgi:YD repeat-containing protein
MILLSAVAFIGCQSKPKPTPTPSEASPEASAAPSPTPAPSPKPSGKKTKIIKIPILSKESRFNASDKLDQYVVSEYDPALKVLLSKTTYDSQRAAPQGRTEYSYDKNGLLVEEAVYGPDKVLKYKLLSVYDAKGLKTEEVRRDARNVAVLTNRYLYDEAGNRTGWKIYMGDTDLLAETEYRYENGLLVRITLRARDREYRGMIQIEHDKKGHEVSRTNITVRGTTESYEEYTYEGDNRIMEKKTGVTGKVLLTILYDYAKDGTLAKRTVKNEKGKVKESTTYEYAYREEEVPVE